MINRSPTSSARWSPKHFYFEKYEVRDGESEYPLLTVRATDEPVSYDEWLREFLEFAWSTNGEQPWSERRIKAFLREDDPQLDVYGGMRIYRRFVLQEINRAEYDVLEQYVR